MFVLSVVLQAVLACEACPATNDEHLTALVRDYREAQRAAAAIGPDSPMRDAQAAIARVDSARAALARAPDRFSGRLVDLLRSGPACRDHALAWVVARRISQDTVAVAVMQEYRPDDSTTMRYDEFVHVFSVLSPRQRTQNASLVRRMLCAERDPSLLAGAVASIQEFGAEVAADMYACCLSQSAPTLQRITLAYLERAGPDVVALVRERLTRAGARDALMALDAAFAASTGSGEGRRE